MIVLVVPLFACLPNKIPPWNKTLQTSKLRTHRLLEMTSLDFYLNRVPSDRDPGGVAGVFTLWPIPAINGSIKFQVDEKAAVPTPILNISDLSVKTFILKWLPVQVQHIMGCYWSHDWRGSWIVSFFHTTGMFKYCDRCLVKHCIYTQSHTTQRLYCLCPCAAIYVLYIKNVYC